MSAGDYRRSGTQRPRKRRTSCPALSLGGSPGTLVRDGCAPGLGPALDAPGSPDRCDNPSGDGCAYRRRTVLPAVLAPCPSLRSSQGRARVALCRQRRMPLRPHAPPTTSVERHSTASRPSPSGGLAASPDTAARLELRGDSAAAPRTAPGGAARARPGAGLCCGWPRPAWRPRPAACRSAPHRRGRRHRAGAEAPRRQRCRGTRWARVAGAWHGASGSLHVATLVGEHITGRPPLERWSK